MNNFQLAVYVGLTMSVVFLLSGLLVQIFGKKIKVESVTKFKLEIWGQTISMPYNVNLVICILGFLLLCLTFNLIMKSGKDEPPINKVNAVFDLTHSVYAQSSNNSSNKILPGWIYFGNGKNKKSWNFDIFNGDYSDLISNPNKLILASKVPLNIRKNHFGNFTGTILGMFNPPPKKIGLLPKDCCVRVVDVKEVGFSKIWLKTEPTDCP